MLHCGGGMERKLEMSSWYHLDVSWSLKVHLNLVVSNIFIYVHPYGEDFQCFFSHIFRMGWNHQLVDLGDVSACTRNVKQAQVTHVDSHQNCRQGNHCGLWGTGAAPFLTPPFSLMVGGKCLPSLFLRKVSDDPWCLEQAWKKMPTQLVDVMLISWLWKTSCPCRFGSGGIFLHIPGCMQHIPTYSA